MLSASFGLVQVYFIAKEKLAIMTAVEGDIIRKIWWVKTFMLKKRRALLPLEVICMAVTNASTKQTCRLAY